LPSTSSLLLCPPELSVVDDASLLEEELVLESLVLVLVSELVLVLESLELLPPHAVSDRTIVPASKTDNSFFLHLITSHKIIYLN
jgi:hypothetical protein